MTFLIISGLLQNKVVQRWPCSLKVYRFQNEQKFNDKCFKTLHITKDKILRHQHQAMHEGENGCTCSRVHVLGQVSGLLVVTALVWSCLIVNNILHMMEQQG